jgi:hypothetical protein
MDYGPAALRTHVMMFNVCYYHCILLDPRTLTATTNNFILSQANCKDIQQEQPSYQAQKQKVIVCNH